MKWNVYRKVCKYSTNTHIEINDDIWYKNKKEVVNHDLSDNVIIHDPGFREWSYKGDIEPQLRF